MEEETTLKTAVVYEDITPKESVPLMGYAERWDASAPIDPRMVVLSLIDESDRERGFLFHYSCHLSVLGVDNYQISADWLGPVREQLQKELGCPVMFLQGAEGNVDPVCRGALDMADPDQAVGSSFEVLQDLADEMTKALSESYRFDLRSVRQLDRLSSPQEQPRGALS